MTISRQGFIDFVNTQDPKRKITQGSWHSCAVGDYLRSLRLPSLRAVDMDDYLHDIFPNGNYFMKPYDYLRDTLNNNYVNIQTYGDLQVLIAKRESKQKESQ